VALIIEGDGYVARDAIVLGIHALGQLPGVTGVPRIGSMRIILKNADHLARIRGIYSDRRFREITRRGSESEDLGLRSLWEILSCEVQWRTEKEG
jgi:hypothetical protein